MTPDHRSLCAVVAALLGFLGVVPDATAQRVPSPYRYIEAGQEIGAFFGTIDPGTGRFDFGPREGPLLGVRYGIEISGPFSLDGVVRTLPTTRNVIDPRRLEGDRKIGEADVLLTSIDARIKFALNGRRTWHGLGPYILLGGGLVFDLAGDQALDEALDPPDRFGFGTQFLGVLGGGARWVPADHFQLRTDGVLNLWQLNNPDGFRDPTRGFEDVSESEWVNGLSITVGAAIRW